MSQSTLQALWIAQRICGGRGPAQNISFTITEVVLPLVSNREDEHGLHDEQQISCHFMKTQDQGLQGTKTSTCRVWILLRLMKSGATLALSYSICRDWPGYTASYVSPLSAFCILRVVYPVIHSKFWFRPLSSPSLRIQDVRRGEEVEVLQTNQSLPDVWLPDWPLLRIPYTDRIYMHISITYR
jgi:hypothetical protein